MRQFLQAVKAEYLLWGVVLGKIIVDLTFPWAAVPVITLLLAKPLLEAYLERVALGKDATREKVAILEQKLTDVQNRIASLSLAAGFKRQGS